jgi:hypothetical protein
MTDYTDEIGDFLEEYIKIHSISFLREDPHTFASRVSKAFSVFFLETTEDNFVKGLKEKALYSFWNTRIDDIIEYTERGKENILDSLGVLIAFRKGENFSGQTTSSRIMYDFMQRFNDLPLGPNKKISKELIFLDLVRVLNGFDYERIVQENDMMSTLAEYMEFGTVITDVRVFLDIDIALYPHKLGLSTIGDLREAYRWFEMAVKLSSDIATFEREYFIEASHNAVILHGCEKGLLPTDVLTNEDVDKEKIFRTIIPSLMKEIEDKGREYLSKSVSCLDKVVEVNTSRISDFFEKTFQEYPWQRNFSPPSNT